MTKYSIPTRKMMRGVVLDLLSKGKMTETCVVESTINVCPAHFKDQPSQWSFNPIPDVTK